MRSVAGMCLAAVLCASVGETCGQTTTTFPSRPVRLITPYEPGGSSTIVSRLVGTKLTEIWGQSVVIDNRPGGNTVIGTQAGARANPDGYTMVFGNTTFVINHLLMRKLPYDSLKDFAPIASIYNNEMMLAVHPSVPASTLAEFIAHAKAHPGQLNQGVASNTGGAFIRAEMFRIATKTDFKNIPYKGNGPVITALLGGHVQFGLVPPITVASYTASGKLKGLAVTGKQRLRTLPQIPTFAEAGLPGYSGTTWNWLMAPAATPKAIIQKISTDVAHVLAMPDIRETLISQGAEPAYLSSQDLSRLISDDVVRYAKVIKEANIQLID